MTENPGRSPSKRSDRVKEVFNRALDHPPEDQHAFVLQECGDDVSLRGEVLDLLGVEEPVVDVLERPAVWQVPYADPDVLELEGLEGSVIGNYQLIRRIGSGGMGVVYLAERVGDIEGTAAVKLIKRGMDSAAVSHRFRYERQVLARLSHPNIAHFIDGGVSAEGRPYFVMQYVEGVPITTYARREKLTVEEKVRLFLQVLDAVAFAHNNLIVHRDVKPSNILVTDEGRPKLLDFGVAKVLGDDGQPGATLTHFGGRVLTPSYSSPEQIRGELVTTAADVYSLGVVLYELFVGKRPFDLDRAPLSEVQDVVSHKMPTKPSSSLVSDLDRPLDTRRLRRSLAGDLDTIVLKALRKEPEERYPSARELHADLCRYLDGHPVEARRGSTAYRARKFLSRHRTAASVLGALSAATLLGGTLVFQERQETERQRLLAEQRVEDVRSLVNTLAFDVHDEVAALPGSTGARKLILDRAFEQLETVRRGLPDDPALFMSLAGVYRRLGDVHGYPSGPSLGDITAARASYAEGLRLADRAVELDPDDILRSRGKGLLHERFGKALAAAGHIEEGRGELVAALDVYEGIAEAFPDSSRHQLTWVIGRINLSDYTGHPHFPNVGDEAGAITGYQAAVAHLQEEPLLSDTSDGVRRFKSLANERIGRMLRLSGDYEGALAAEDESLRVRQELYRDNPGNNNMQRDVAVSHQNRCSVLMLLGRTGEAEGECHTAAGVYRERLRLDPVNAGNIRDMTLIHRAYEELFLTVGDTVRAVQHLEQVVDWAEQHLALDSTALLPRRDMLDALLTLGALEQGQEVFSPWRERTRFLVEQLREEGHLSAADSVAFAQIEAPSD